MTDPLFPQRQWSQGKPTPPPADECPGCGARPAEWPCPTCARLDALFVDLYEPRLIEVEEELPFTDTTDVQS